MNLAVKFRAVHINRPWRRAAHSSEWAAIEGKDGARNLLLQVGRVGLKWAQYGAVAAVFVWDDDQETCSVFRLRPGSMSEIQTANIPVDVALQHEEAQECSQSDIDGYFQNIPEDQPTTPPVEESPGRDWKYGKPSWQVVLDAVGDCEDRATVADITARVLDEVPEFNVGNVLPDLNLLSVNSPSRGHYGPNFKPRSSDQGSPYDALYMERLEGVTTYVFYDKDKHGVWQLIEVEGHRRLQSRLVKEAELASELLHARTAAEAERAFDPGSSVDAREMPLGQIVRRQGQQRFRQALLAAYNGRCAISGCDAPEALEAAHIQGYLGLHTNVVINGLLLRADLHTLFDLGLLRIDPETMKVVLASRLVDSQYGALDGVAIQLPANKEEWPSAEALRLHGKNSLAF